MADFERSTTITRSTDGQEINASSMIFFKQISLFPRNDPSAVTTILHCAS